MTQLVSFQTGYNFQLFVISLSLNTDVFGHAIWRLAFSFI